MSRRRDFEIQFGSDSFLDVVANIVGILIILIVIAGVRVSKTPPKPKTSPAVPTLDLPVAPAPPVDPPDETDSAAPEPIMAEVTPEMDSEIPEALPPLEPPPELVDRVRQLEAEVAAITAESRTLGDALAESHRLQTTLDERLQTARGLLDERKSQLNAVTARDAQQKQDLELTRQAVARLLQQVTDLEQKTPPVEKLEHRITPVSRTVLGQELHFRLEGDRVAEVPIEALVERLKDHIERRKDWIIKTRQHKGQVGPINGFNLEYILGVEMITGLEELRGGVGGYRMSMRYWEIQPEPSLRGEPEDVALSQGSKFYQALVGAGPDTTLTFWVYPDSYNLYRKLQRFAHDQGFPVAGRPLPAGVAISGSPNGTKSASQ
ncbi:MAG: hypothetical protein JSS49_12100 [Planctomycetes bacterium]|nr:hypothetical protein [Planctomycetota bacterium]